jgi:hypothetical protein
VSPVKCELGFYIPEYDILHSDRCENPKSYIFHMLEDTELHTVFCKYLVSVTVFL